MSMQVIIGISAHPLEALLDPDYHKKVSNLQAVYENAPEVMEYLVTAVIAFKAGNIDAVKSVLGSADRFLTEHKIVS